MVDEPEKQKAMPGAGWARAFQWILWHVGPPFLAVIGLTVVSLWLTIITLGYLPLTFWQSGIGSIVGALSFGLMLVLLFMLLIIIFGMRPIWLYFRAKYIDHQPLGLYMDAAKAKFIIPEMDAATGALTIEEGKIKKVFNSITEYRFLFYGSPLYLVSAFHNTTIHPVHMVAGDVLAKEADLPEGQGSIKKEGIEVSGIALLTHAYLKTFLNAVVNPASVAIYIKNEIQRQRAGEKAGLLEGQAKFLVIGMAFIMITIGIVILWNAGILHAQSWCPAGGTAAGAKAGMSLPKLPGLGI